MNLMACAVAWPALFTPQRIETPIGAWILGAVAADKGEARSACPFQGPMRDEWLSGWRAWRAHQQRAAR
jgi:ribosome modulation factor